MMLIPCSLQCKGVRGEKESKTRRVCYGDYRGRRLDYNEDGKVFVLDPYLEPSAMLNKYKDKDADKITDSFRYFVELALEKGLMKGDQFGYLNPQNPVTRGEAAAFIYNALNLDENNFVKPKRERNSCTEDNSQEEKYKCGNSYFAGTGMGFNKQYTGE